MASIISKKVRSQTYHYPRERVRVAAKPKMVSERYLGRAADVEAAMDGAEMVPERTRHLPFGDLVATWSMLERLGVVETIDEVVGSRRAGAGASVGFYLALATASRIVPRCSKLAFSNWWNTTAGDRLVKVPRAALHHRGFGMRWTSSAMSRSLRSNCGSPDKPSRSATSMAPASASS
jgi:hypothetical protein